MADKGEQLILFRYVYRGARSGQLIRQPICVLPEPDRHRSVTYPSMTGRLPLAIAIQNQSDRSLPRLPVVSNGLWLRCIFPVAHFALV